jgi:hypothetical protein
MRRICFHHTRNFRGSMHRTSPYKHVDVIGDPTDNQRRLVHLANDPAEISEYVIADVRHDQWTSLVRAPDEMQKNVSAGV